MDNEKFRICQTINDLDKPDQDLAEAAREALDISYAPYSKFNVAAALRLSNGEIVTGVNQENASSPAGLCAEQVALYRKGIAWPDEKITGIAIIARTESGNEVTISPCGNCRQVMVEFVHRQDQSFHVIMKWEGDSWLIVKKMEDLLPFSFTAKSR